jgi:hypothetical protein
METHKDLKERVEELKSQFLSKDPKLIIPADHLKLAQRETLHYFDLNGISTSTFAGYWEVQQLNFSPLQPSGADAKKKLMDRLHGNLCRVSNALDRAEELIRKGEVTRGGSPGGTETEVYKRVARELPTLAGGDIVPYRVEHPDPGVADSRAASPRDSHKSRIRQMCAAVSKVFEELNELQSCSYPDYESMRSNNRTMAVFQIADQDPTHTVALGKKHTSLKDALLHLPEHSRHLLGLAKAFVAKQFDVSPDALQRHWKKRKTRV